jgi:hypothetical protein
MTLNRSLRWPVRALGRGAVLTASVFCAVFMCSHLSGASFPTPVAHRGASQKGDAKSQAPSTTKLKILVTSDDGKPVGNASVYVRFPVSGGFLRHDKLQELDLKTNEDGSVRVPEIPQGKVLVQVIAKNWHTFGKWYDIEKAEDSIVIKLKAPPHWY